MAHARLLDSTDVVVTRLATKTGKTKQEILDQAVRLYEREQFFAELDAGFDRLSAQDLAELNAEREEWDVTLADGTE